MSRKGRYGEDDDEEEVLQITVQKTLDVQQSSLDTVEEIARISSIALTTATDNSQSIYRQGEQINQIVTKVDEVGDKIKVADEKVKYIDKLASTSAFIPVFGNAPKDYDPNMASKTKPPSTGGGFFSTKNNTAQDKYILAQHAYQLDKPPTGSDGRSLWKSRDTSLPKEGYGKFTLDHLYPKSGNNNGSGSEIVYGGGPDGFVGTGGTDEQKAQSSKYESKLDAGLDAVLQNVLIMNDLARTDNQELRAQNERLINMNQNVKGHDEILNRANQKLNKILKQ